MGWTGQTRQLMWTGQKYRPVRVKCQKYNKYKQDFRLSSKNLLSPFSVRFARSQIALTEVGTQFYLTLCYAKSHALQSTVSDMSQIALTMVHNYVPES